ncbi:hypothetical protein HK101_003591 [Irineochytrium annulatum]|nr:hypothetical protein HK101_003591 [Irineochytrium annulatum]
MTAAPNTVMQLSEKSSAHVSEVGLWVFEVEEKEGGERWRLKASGKEGMVEWLGVLRGWITTRKEVAEVVERANKEASERSLVGLEGVGATAAAKETGAGVKEERESKSGWGSLMRPGSLMRGGERGEEGRRRSDGSVLGSVGVLARSRGGSVVSTSHASVLPPAVSVAASEAGSGSQGRPGSVALTSADAGSGSQGRPGSVALTSADAGSGSQGRPGSIALTTEVPAGDEEDEDDGGELLPGETKEQRTTRLAIEKRRFEELKRIAEEKLRSQQETNLADLALISSIMGLSKRLQTGSTYCNVSGWLVQWSVQQSDCTTFALAVVTFLIATSSRDIDTLVRMLKSLERSSLYIVAILILLPAVTATIGYALVGMANTGSWCWFSPPSLNPNGNYVRYGLTHGPRMVMILGIIGMYSWLFVQFRRRIEEGEMEQAEMEWGEEEERNVGAPRAPLKMEDGAAAGFGNDGPVNGASMNSWGSGAGATRASEDERREVRKASQASKRAILKLLIYPSVYTLLWIPGIANRLAEATNAPPETLAVTNFLQFTTQLVGAANAVIYGFSTFCQRRT